MRETDVQPVMHAYMRLYLGMKNILDMGDYDVVKQNAAALRQVFSLPISDPRSMPVTRDLAPAKIQMVLNWLANGLPRDFDVKNKGDSVKVSVSVRTSAR